MVLPKWLNRKSKREESDRKVKRIAKMRGSKCVSGSGSSIYQKGDEKDEKFLFEHKHTEKLSYRITPALMLKIKEEALFEDRIPVFVIHFDEELSQKIYYVIDEQGFKEFESCLMK